MNQPRILVAGIGNIFFGDDAFGVEVARRLAGLPQPDGVIVRDFGIRGFDLAYALMDGYDLAILVDAMPRGGRPGTLYVLEPEQSQPTAENEMVDTHGMNPTKVLRLVQFLGGEALPVRVVGCEPGVFGTEEDPVMGLSAPVEAAVAEAAQLIRTMVAECCTKSEAAMEVSS